MYLVLDFKLIVVIVSIFIVSSFISLLILPYVIKAATKYNWLDKPNERKLHLIPIPSFGGIGVFSPLLIFIGFLLTFDFSFSTLILLFSVIVLLLLGFIDDLKDLKASKKLLVQIIISSLLYFAGFKISGLYGLAGVYEISGFYSFILTLVFYIVTINAFNLIDGIDSLAGGLCFINFLTMSFLFMIGDNMQYLFICVIILGGLIGFLKYNYNPARIFLGDTGSLPLGLLNGVFIIELLNIFTSHEFKLMSFDKLIPILIAMLIIPVFDTLRVFVTRIIDGNSPFKADKTHVHHLLLQLGLGHFKSALFLHLLHVVIIVFSYFFHSYLRLEFALIFSIGIVYFFIEYISALKYYEQIKLMKSLRNEFFQIISKNRLLIKLKKFKS